MSPSTASRLHLSLNLYLFPAGSSIKHVLITESVAQRKTAPIYLARGQQHRFQTMIAAEEEEWDARDNAGKKTNDGSSDSHNVDSGESGSFQEYREKSTAIGVM